MSVRPLALIVLGFAMIAGCKKPATTLSDADMTYVRTTLAIMRTKASLPGGTDSLGVDSALNATYAKLRISRADYLKQTSDLASDPNRFNNIYKAINDSLEFKK